MIRAKEGVCTYYALLRAETGWLADLLIWVAGMACLIIIVSVELVNY